MASKSKRDESRWRRLVSEKERRMSEAATSCRSLPVSCSLHVYKTGQRWREQLGLRGMHGDGDEHLRQKTHEVLELWIIQILKIFKRVEAQTIHVFQCRERRDLRGRICAERSR